MNTIPSSEPFRKSRSHWGWLPTVMLLGFAILAGMSALGLRQQLRSMPSEETWRKVPAQVIAAGIEVEAGNKLPFTAWVEYTYVHYEEIGGVVDGRGRTLTSRQVMDGGLVGKDYTDLWLKIRPFVPGNPAFAYVDPANPERSVLLMDSSVQRVLAAILSALCLASLSGVVALWRPRKANAAPREGRSFTLFAVFSLILFAGVGLLQAISLPLWRAAWGVTWVKTPCTVIYSEVRHSISREEGGAHNGHRTRVTDNYRPDILFEYQVEGVTHRSNRYAPLDTPSSGREEKQAVVKANPPGHPTECYVNQKEPWEALFTTRIGARMLMSLFPLPFLLAGGFGLRWWWGSRRGGASAQRSPGTGSLPDEHADAPESAGDGAEVVLKPSSNRGCALIMLAALALVWNGAVWSYSLPKFGAPGGFPVLEMLVWAPLWLLGLAFLGAFGISLLALFNARFEITLTQGRPRLGRATPFRWRMTPASWAPQPVRVIMKVRADRTVTSGQGKNRRTRSEMVWEETVVDQADRFELQEGQGTFTLPAHVEQVSGWKLVVEADVPGWPDLLEEFEIQVPGSVPAPDSAGQGSEPTRAS